uniref:Essential MCU regulator, mitochondrial n=1 Tax=Sinocyclocheilus rhinocerous TaxID=307959 RepID=A0A673IG01_9TELE
GAVARVLWLVATWFLGYPEWLLGWLIARGSLCGCSDTFLQICCCRSQTAFGLVRIMMVVAPFLYAGTLISKNFAALLEEHDIFVPEDDDD